VVEAETCRFNWTLVGSRYPNHRLSGRLQANDYSWLNVAVLDRKGRIRDDGGVVATPGMYVMGLRWFLRRRKSAPIDGAGADAHGP
jgi:hypothetical protein